MMFIPVTQGKVITAELIAPHSDITTKGEFEETKKKRNF